MKQHTNLIPVRTVAEQAGTSLHNLKGFRTIGKPVAALLLGSLLFSACRKPDLQQQQDAANTQAPGKTAITNSVTGDEFTIVVLPDTQYYTRDTGYNGGRFTTLQAQIDWIKANATTEKIAYVVHVGDIVDNPDRQIEWDNAKNAFYQLEQAVAGYPDGIPYGLAVGNHDQLPDGAGVPQGTNPMYNSYFGVSHFQGKSYYGGNYQTDNDNHYDFFSAGGLDFIVIYMEYDDVVTDATRVAIRNARLTWADNLLAQYPNKKAIIVTHNMVARNSTPGTNYAAAEPYSAQGLSIYNKIKNRPNVIMMLGGHVAATPPDGEGYRQDTYNGHTIRGSLSNYQDRPLGGGGFLRLMKFSKNSDRVSISTYSPYYQSINQTPFFETDGDSQFTVPLFNEPSASRTSDFDNNGRSELSLYLPLTGIWKTFGNADVQFGQSGDIPMAADYDGDGKTDVAIYRPSTFNWHISTMPNVNFGQAGDIPIPADYDGDGRADVAVWRPSDFSWHLSSVADVVYGQSGDIPVPADYNGDGKADVAVWRPSNGTWYVRNIETNAYGTAGDIPVPGDYNGDGYIDYAVFRPSTNSWHIKDQLTHNTTRYDLTAYVAGDIPMPGDYDGDGKTDPALYRPSTGQLFVKNVLTQTITGASSAKAVNLPYSVRRVFFP